MNYLYDNSFEGFLTCVYEHYYNERADGIFPEASYQLDLTIRATVAVTDEDKALRVAEAIGKKISSYDMERIYRVFRTNEPEKEMKLLRYIVLGFNVPAPRLLHGNKIVADVQKAERRIGTEVHRLCGLVRFAVSSSGDGGGREILYSKIEPDNDVLEFLAPHFTDRFKNDPFIIHDSKRGKALFAYGNKWSISDFEDEELLTNAASEDEYQRLWKLYHRIMAIKERTNPGCQRSFMPVRYWNNLPEVR